MRHPHGVDPDDPCADVLVALMRERYGDLRALERERFSAVRPKRPTMYEQRVNRAEGRRRLLVLDDALDEEGNAA